MNDLHRMQLEKAGQRAKARARAGRVETVAPPSQPVEEDPMMKVLFASERARELAEESALTWKDFANSLQVASGVHGYTADDVRAILAEKE